MEYVMGVGWIDSIYNNTDQPWWFASADSSHNGRLVRLSDHWSFTLDDRQYHQIDPRTQYWAQWCGIPWFYQALHYKSLSINQDNNVRMYTSQTAGVNYIVYEDGKTGRVVGRQEVPKNVDFHCRLRIEDDGNFIDVLNDDGTTREATVEVYNEAKEWVKVVISILGLLVGKAGGK
jgi:hypothetical protein